MGLGKKVSRSSHHNHASPPTHLKPARLTTCSPGSPNSANPQWPVGSPHPRQCPLIASKERQADEVSTGSAQTSHARIPQREPFPRPQLHLQVPTVRSRGELYSGPKKGFARYRRDSYTILPLDLQGYTHPLCSPF